jgi:hypothetical protein
MDRVRFLHIPKTAGSSFTRCLSRIYGARSFRENWFTLRWDIPGDLERYRSLPPARRAAIVLVTGHAPRVTGEPEIDTLPTVTFLRDPVERFKSFCQHVSEGKAPELYPAAGFDLDRFLDYAAVAADEQTRYLLGRGSLELPQGTPAQLAAQALAVLEGLAAYGISERFEESLLLFRRALAWKAWPVYTSLNRKDPRRLLAFDERQIERIRDLNRIDIMVYEQARERLLERLRRDATPLRAEMRRFRLRQAVAAPFLAVYRLEHALRAARLRRSGRRSFTRGR